MKLLFAVIGVCALVLAPAARAADPEIQALIHQFDVAFNKGDMAAAKAMHVAAPTIIDEAPPHYWSGPTAFDAWVADLTKSETADGVSGDQLAIGPLTRQVISGDHAYVVAPATFTFKQKGVAMREVAQMTFVLAKQKSGWKIAAWTWSGPDPKPVK